MTQKYVDIKEDTIDAPQHDNIDEHESPGGGPNLHSFTHAGVKHYLS